MKYIRFIISSYCLCVYVLSEDERPISHLNKKINEKYMLTTGEKSIIDHIEMYTYAYKLTIMTSSFLSDWYLNEQTMIRSFESNRGREKKKKRRIYIYSRHTFADVANWIFFFFSFLKTYLQGLKKRTRCHAEVKQYCSKCIRVTESEGVSIIKVVALMSNEYFISWFDELKMRLDLSKTFFVDVYIYKICI